MGWVPINWWNVWAQAGHDPLGIKGSSHKTSNDKKSRKKTVKELEIELESARKAYDAWSKANDNTALGMTIAVGVFAIIMMLLCFWMTTEDEREQRRKERILQEIKQELEKEKSQASKSNNKIIDWFSALNNYRQQ